MDLLLSVDRVLSSPKDDPIFDCAILIRDKIITTIGRGRSHLTGCRPAGLPLLDRITRVDQRSRTSGV
jgi:hypothetical protein